MTFDFTGYTLEQALDSMYPAQKAAFHEIMHGTSNVLLTASGGHGKSYVIDAVKYFMRDEVILTASTGAASVLIGGTTSHSTLALPLNIPSPENMRKTSSRYKGIFKRNHPVTTIVIDEAPMLGPQTVDAVLQRLERIRKTAKDKNVKLVMSGDFSQCLNVVKAKDRPLIEEKYGTTMLLDSDVFKQCNFKIIELDQNKRIGTNKEFGDILELLRLGYDKEKVCNYLNQFVGNPIPDAPYIVPRNDEADIINNKAFNDNPNQSVTYFSKTKGDFDLRDTQMLDVLHLKVGLRVMCLVNEPTMGDEQPRYVNGSVGVVTELALDMVRVLFDNGNDVWMDRTTQKNIEYYTDSEGKLCERGLGQFSQIGLKICYALSINKSQGVSLEKANIDFGSKGCFAYGQAYTAISRLTNPEGLRLIKPIYPSDIKVHRTVRKFYEGLRGVATLFPVIIAGGRDFNDYNLLCRRMDSLLQSKNPSDIVIVSGTANGADKLGERYAQERGLKLWQFPADWNRLRKRAGYERNVMMADHSDALVAFWDQQSAGTKHMIDIAKEKGLAVRVINY